MEARRNAACAALIAILCAARLCVSQSDELVVSTKYGAVRGVTRHLAAIKGNITKINRFLGIPFASPPVKKLRFSPPVPPEPWDDVYDATNFKAMCFQDPEYNRMFWTGFSWRQSDDCLYLNIYAPNSTGTKYAVMVYIHGGGYEAGSPIISPGDAIPLWGVVLVTIQYRLGPFGFMSTGDSVAPGNYGMLDQIAALKWVQENIAAFHGDPSRVTIFGESAGGSSVGLLLLSPLSKGLFHYAIALSGVDFSPFAINRVDEAVQLTKKTARNVKCPTHDSTEMMECMRRLKGEEIPVNEINKWRPIVDNIFLEDTPVNLRKANKFHPYPFIAGLTSEEGSYFFSDDFFKNVTFETFKDDAITFYQSVRRFGREGPNFKLAASLKEAIVFHYTPWPDLGDSSGFRAALVDMVTDFSIAAPAHAVLDFHSKQAPSYLYVFSHRSKNRSIPKWKGVGHKDDTPYEFGFPFLDLDKALTQQEYDDVDRNVSNYIITFFTNFAKTGHPTPEPVAGITWSQYNETYPAYMNITAQPRIEYNFHEKSMAFWNSYYPKLLETTSCYQGDTLGSTSSASSLSLFYSAYAIYLTTQSSYNRNLVEVKIVRIPGYAAFGDKIMMSLNYKGFQGIPFY
ncbi:predicted protein [Nematostella vectensis]|uniref:Bile salt-activated lipase n=1 Tax=Nematostella vectensis TaxID=45351 RepID=A7RXL6_NEMVE|nr:predicted protein [Nematostella vectensis]|eukprot:XP_001635931.1 predicted protein [Nematostella vectensis]